jgi:hypothetical protein
MTPAAGPVDRGTAAPGPGARSTGLAIAVVLLAVLAALAVVQWAARPRADYGGASFAEVEQAFHMAGLQVCAEDRRPTGLAPAAVESRTYDLAERCTGARASAVVDRFSSATARDGAARQFESLTRPRGSGVVYTLGDTTVFLQGSGDQDVRERLGAALHAAGAR